LKLKNDYIDLLQALNRSSSLSEAAHKLSVTSIAAGKKLKLLEEALRRPIVDRSGKKLRLNSYGRQIAELTSSIHSDLIALDRWLGRPFDDIGGEVRIVCHDEAVLQMTIFPFLEKFHNQNPHIKLNLEVKSPKSSPNNIDADIYWGVSSYVFRDFPDSVVRLINHYGVGIYASQKYVSKYGTPMSLEDLWDHKLIGSTNRKPSQTLIACDEGVMVGITMDVSIILSQGTIQAAIDGIGILNYASEHPEIKKAIAFGGISPILNKYWMKTFPIYTCYDRAAVKDPLIKQVVDYFLKMNA
jgi:DNA-binding transcriptional LysR family regulator